MLDSSPMLAGSTLAGNIRQHYLFAGLAPADFDALATHTTVRSMQKGQVLFHRGDPADSFYYVDSGQIELSLIAPTGEKKILEVIGEGGIFAEAVAFMREVKFPVTAEALVDSTLGEIPNRVYVDLLYSNPDACMRLLGDVCRNLHARVREIEYLTVQNARSRLASYLLEHIVDSSDDKVTVHLDLPRHVIASRLSIKPETLSRLLRSMIEEGIVSIDDRVVSVHSVARLRPYN